LIFRKQNSKNESYLKPDNLPLELDHRTLTSLSRLKSAVTPYLEN